MDQDMSGHGPEHPQQIGPYRIIRVLGEGGMGMVYEAADTGPVRRHVALKIVRAGLDSREIRARFDAERQALALMDHAGIAKVFQAGETEAGEPFFAMELVKGSPINEYCDSRRLSTTERLELFIAVCEAVQHAHQKGVIHRDLKPSNVLVTEQDGKACPKIIDFGIAKALGLRLTDQTFVTHAGQPLGTAAYMSPEQAESSGLDVDTRSDVYSLGVILYLLLVGNLPLDPSGLPMHAFMYRLASRDHQMPRPSARYTELGEYKEAIAKVRHTDPEHLQRDLKGDLDWIVMKALEPERSRRYDTAIGLAADIKRFLAHEPVVARPPTTGYRLQKFVRRHRGAVAATGVAVGALAVSAVLATAGMLRATRAERRASNEAAVARQVSDFMVAVFKVERDEQGTPITARELLDRGAARSAMALAEQPEIQSRMMYTIGAAYASLGLYDVARAQLERALATRKRVLGPNDSSAIETEIALADALADHGDMAEAEKHYARVLGVKSSGGDHVHRHAHRAEALGGLAAIRFRQGRMKDAESFYRQALAMDKRVNEKDSLRAGQHLVNLGIVYWAQQRYPEAEQSMRRGLSIQERRLGPGDPGLASTLNNLGAVYWTQGRYAEALPLYERTKAIFEQTLDPTHPNIAAILNNIAETYWKLRRFNEAEPLFRRALAIKEARLSRGNPSIAVTLNGLAGLLRDEGRVAESEAAYKRALGIRETALRPGDASLAETVKDYGELLRATGRVSEADALARKYNVPR